MVLVLASVTTRNQVACYVVHIETHSQGGRLGSCIPEELQVLALNRNARSSIELLRLSARSSGVLSYVSREDVEVAKGFAR